jgi:hypothetical protein
MRDEYSDIPINIETAETGRYLTVTRTNQAASLLVEKWPRSNGPNTALP